jgi:hypothetical protein
MPTRVTNISKSLLIVPLNSGETLHLAPGETSADPLGDYELDGNEKFEKMLSNNLLARAPEESGSQVDATTHPFGATEPQPPAPRKKPTS